MIQPELRPDCELIGTDGNVFSLIGTVSKCLKRNGFKDEAKEMSERAFGAGSYSEVLVMFNDYVNIN